MITIITISAIDPSLATAYGKNGLPSFFRIEYSRRYASFCAWFIPWPSRSHFRRRVLVLEHRVLGIRLDPRGRSRTELGHEVDVHADQRGDRARDQHHVNRAEARPRGRAPIGAAAQKVRQERPDERSRAV